MIKFLEKNDNKKLDPETRAYVRARKIKRTIKGIFLGVIIVGMCFTMIYPLLKLIPNVTGDPSDLGNPDVIWIPIKRSLVSFKGAKRIIMKQGWLTMVKSLLYAAVIVTVQAFMSAMTGYAIARVKFPGSKLIFMLVLLVFLVPPQALLMSQYLYFKHFDVFGIITGLANVLKNITGHEVIKLSVGEGIDIINKEGTLYLLALLGFGVNQSLFIFIFRQFFKNSPKELEEAALIDGCGFNGTYFKIMLPNAKPAIATVLSLGFVWNYGDTYYTGYFNPTGPYLAHILQVEFRESQLQSVLNRMQVWFGLPNVTSFTFNAVKEAAALIYMLPLLIAYFVAQNWLVENIENAGIVG